MTRIPSFPLSAALMSGLFAAHVSATTPVLADPPLPATLEVAASQGRLTDGLLRARALNVRGSWVMRSGDVAHAEVLEESKFGSRGGIVAAGYTRVLSADWIVAGSLAAGHGGPNWANTRIDLEVTTKWLPSQALLTRAAVYHARFDNARSDRGLRLSAVGYLPGTLVLEGGAIFNVSQPGSVNSTMPFVSATLGSEGVQYFSARASNGEEAYQALGDGQQLVNFKSRSLGLQWRRWAGRAWGVTAQGEHYHNPSYERFTLGAGVFAQW